jgi:hypothetical protein
MRAEETPVADTLRRAHAAVLEDLRALEQAVGPGPGGSAAQVCARLEAMQAHLVRHFLFEEWNGYLDGVRQKEPRLGRAVEKLAGEHRELADELEGLVAATRAGDPEGSLRERVRRWLGRVRRHEARGNDLVQDAFGLDLGAED